MIGLTKPVLRLLGIFAAIPLGWIALGLLFLSLPSPLIKDLDIQAARVFNQVVQFGHAESIFRVYDRDHFYPNRGDSVQSLQIDSQTVSLNLEHLHERGYIAVEFAYNGPSRYNTEGQFEIRSAGSTERINCWDMLDTQQNTTTTLVPYVRLGDDDGPSPPWFHWADSALLFAESRSMVGEVSISPAPIQARCERQPSSDPFIRMQLFALSKAGVTTPPLISVDFLANASVHSVHFPMADPDEDPLCGAPSLTFGLRSMLLAVLGPSAILAEKILVNFVDTFGWLVSLIWRISVVVGIVGFAIYLSKYRRRKDPPSLPALDRPQPPPPRLYSRLFEHQAGAKVSKPQQAVVSVQSIRPQERLFDVKSEKQFSLV